MCVGFGGCPITEANSNTVSQTESEYYTLHSNWAGINTAPNIKQDPRPISFFNNAR